MLMQNFGATIKKHYGMLWYFLEWPILLVKKHLELVEMMFGLVNASFNLPEWQKMIFLVHLTEVSAL